jgi:ferredoxin-NADP reductase
MEALSADSHACSRRGSFATRILKRRRLSDTTFELTLLRPRGFAFEAGQRIRLKHGAFERDYTMVSAPLEECLRLCIRRVAGGLLSGLLAGSSEGSPLTFTGPHGYFTFKPSPRLAVFVATGAGIAPFCSMAASGVSGFWLLHGVSSAAGLHYRELMQMRAGRYVPCLSGEPSDLPRCFAGRVTAFLEMRLPAAAYDFYLCGRQEMIRDATLIVDERFTGSRVYSEAFY